MSLVADFKQRSPASQFLMLAALCWPLIALSVWTDVAIVSWPITQRGVPFQVDFANLWLGAKAGASGDYGALFTAQTHAARASEIFGAVHGLMVWSYPPTIMLMLLPLGFVTNYAVACCIWTAVGLTLYVAALTHARPAAPGRIALVLAAAALVPGVFVALSYGQTALFTSAALYFGVAFASRRPVLAAVIIATLACKPQLALALVPALAVRGDWRAFIWSGVLTAVFLVGTVLALGWQPWELFFNVTLPQQAQFLLDQSVSPSLQMSAYYMATALGLPGAPVQAITSIGVVALMCCVLRRHDDPDIRFLAIALATLNMSPYLQTYETPLLALALGRVVLSTHALALLGPARVTLLLVIATLGLVLTAGVVSRSGVNFSPLLLLAMFFPLMPSLRESFRARVQPSAMAAQF